MAISDPVSLGATATATDNAATYTHTTTATAPAGAKIVVACAWSSNGVPGTMTVSGGGLSGWAQDHRVTSGISLEPAAEMWSAEAPAGLASGTVITFDPSSAVCFGMNMAACYVVGVAATAYEDASAGAARFGAANTTAAWATGTLDTTGEGVGIAFAYADGLTDPGSSAPDANTTELNQSYNTTDQWGAVLNFRRRANAGTVANGGTWSNDPFFNDIVVAVAYKAATVVEEDPLIFRKRRSRMTSW